MLMSSGDDRKFLQCTNIVCYANALSITNGIKVVRLSVGSRRAAS